MESDNNFFKFEGVNVENKFSLFQKIFAISIVLFFILTPLSDISPETFVIPKS